MISFSQLNMWEPTAIGALLAGFRTSGLWLDAISHQAKLSLWQNIIRPHQHSCLAIKHELVHSSELVRTGRGAGKDKK